jgi:hypothetical protein
MEKSEFIDKLCIEAKKKQELKTIEDSFVKNIIKEKCPKKLFEKAGSRKTFNEIKKSKEYKQFFKELRARLRDAYGLFVVDNYNKREKLFKELLKNPTMENHIEILKLHKSSNERIDYYPFLYTQIFSITGKPNKILDLGCGLNPFSYPFLDCKPEYIACDISPGDCGLIQKFFDYFNINGTAFYFNLIEFKKTKFAHFLLDIDICFMLKIVDTLEDQKKGITQNIIKGINCKALVISFSTISIGGKTEIKKRFWFENLLKKMGRKFEIMKVPNEIFYIIL